MKLPHELLLEELLEAHLCSLKTLFEALQMLFLKVSLKSFEVLLELLIEVFLKVLFEVLLEVILKVILEMLIKYSLSDPQIDS